MQRLHKMLTITRLMLLLLLILGALTAIQAQETQRSINNIFIHSASTAIFIENADGTQTLTLQNAPQFTPWLTPNVTVGSVPTADIAVNFPVTDTGSTAIMELGQLTVFLTLLEAAYDPATDELVYQVQVNNVTSTQAAKSDADVGKEIIVPRDLNNVTLLLPADTDLTLTLLLGADLSNTPNLTNVRNAEDGPTCAELPLLLQNLGLLRGQVTADNLETYNGLVSAYEAALDVC